MLQKRYENTCNWILSHNDFISWEKGDGKAVLWIDGGPGCGKSVLSAFMAKELHLSAHGNQRSVVYFFCDDKDDRLRTARAILANWLAQLLWQTPDFLAHFPEESREKPGQTVWTFGMLWRVFRRVIQNARGPVCLLVDALGIFSRTVCTKNGTN